jgi:hypothetical protein
MSSTIQAIVDLLAHAVWPIFFIWFLKAYEADLRALLPRIRKIGSSGFELEASASTQKASENALSDTESSTKILKDFAGTTRSPAIADVELALHDALQDKIKTKQIKENDEVDYLVRELAISHLIIHFLRVYNVIFGSQIRALQILNQRGPMKFSELAVLYDEAKTSDPSFYGDYNFDQWLTFLLQVFLIRAENEIVEITPTGFDFLQFLLASKLNTGRRG